MEFASFGPAEAAVWLARTGSGRTAPDGRLTLAELYAMKAQRLPRPSLRGVGFRPPEVRAGTVVALAEAT
jgi:hypothetical protein